ncbi:uncharacterized protein LOC119953541 [Scyliorhinus canicula]|uniref:uncharacterized protein LOC119953541 n=1 Tax=Scyliorhinus canicula TaxID=7830 RepID=UPI0018F3058E|nr:uncharacterized protein LOC119953541 [Scyliorhinus canicula]
MVPNEISSTTRIWPRIITHIINANGLTIDFDADVQEKLYFQENTALVPLAHTDKDDSCIYEAILCLHKQKSERGERRRLADVILEVDHQYSINQTPELLAGGKTLQVEFGLLSINRAVRLLRCLLGALYELWEKASHLLTHQLRWQVASREIVQVRDGAGRLVSTPTKVNGSFKVLYWNLYESQHPEDESLIPEVLDGLAFLVVEQEEKEELENPLTLEEIKENVGLMQSGKGPGSDRFTIEFLKTSSWFLIPVLLEMFKDSVTQETLSTILVQATIFLILKKDKSPMKYKSYHPISLLNADAKLLAKWFYRAVMLNSVGVIVLFTVSCLSGLVMYAVYETCDPIKMNRVSTSDQLTPLLVVDLFDQMPGFPGLFVASAYSGTLSTISSGISAMAAVAVEDFLKPIWKPWAQLSSRKKTLSQSSYAMTFGLTTIGLAGVSSLLGRNVVQVTLMFDGLILGPILGVFTLAALFPKSNGKGACVGWFVGVAFSMWIGIGGLIYPPSRELSELLETSTAGCLEANATTSTPVNVTSMLTTLIPTKQEERPDIAENLYAISFYYYGSIGCLSTVLVGLIISMLTGGTENVDPCLIAPIVHTIYKYVFKNKLNASIPETSDNLITIPVLKQSSKGSVDSPVLNPIKSTRI